MLKTKFVCAFIFYSSIAFAQSPIATLKDNISSIRTNKIVKEKEDIKYEMAHKSQPWFSQMKQPGADYFAVKRSFEKYFVQHRWEKSKPRELGETWLKTNIFYLDKKGKVQTPPPFNSTNHIANAPNKVTGITTRTVGSWTMIGPVNSATTAYSGSGNHGGYVYLNRIDPTNTQKMFAGFLTGGLWMTTDAGVSWTLTDANNPDVTYHDIDVCTNTPSIVYAINQRQVIKSIDGGLNWSATTLTSTSYSGTAYDIAVSPANPNIVIARWGDKIYRTTDGGTIWSTIQSGLPNHSIWDCSNHSEMIDWSTTNNNVVYSLTTSHNNQVRVYRSADAGASFTLITTITLDAAANGQVVGWAKLLLPSNNATDIYVAIGTGANSYAHTSVQLYKLNNTTGAEVLKRVNMINGTDPNELHHGDLAMDRNNEARIVWGTYSQNYVHYSTNNGVSFINSPTTTHSDIRSIDMVSNTVLIGSDGEASLSTDGGINCATVTNSISNHELWGFGAAFKTNIVASGNNHGPVMISEAGSGFEWYNGTGADQGNTDVNPLDDRYIYSQGYSNYRYLRTGIHTLTNESNYLDLGGIYSYFNSVEFHPNYYYTLITHHAGQYPSGNPNLATWKNSLIKSEDNGNSLSIINTFTDQVFREKICMTNPDYIYVVVGLTNNKLWRTTDGGTTWDDVTPSSAASSGQTNISDLAVSDTNPDEVWLTYSGVQSSCKVLKTTTGGSSWTNLTQPILTANPNTKIIFQRGSDGGVYVGNNSGVYYRNNSMPNWVLLGNGLPAMDIRFMFINYTLGKLRIGTSRGAWEHNLYETSPPKAQLSSSIKKILCPEVETVQFKDYSTVRNASAIWSWSFPGGTPSASADENPVVSYAGAADGFYNVSLTVTDAYGTSSQTINNLIEVSNKCGSTTVDTIPGNTASLGGNATQDYVSIQGLNSNTSGFTFSCWIKPNGTQPDYSGIFMTQTGSTFGLNFRPGTNELGFHPNWSWSSGLYAPSDVWTHVVLVSDATGVTLFANGRSSKNTSLFANINFTELFLATYGRGYTDRSVNCEIDEVCIWNRALTTDEVRKWRHLTKSNAGDPILTGLVGYYQFNELEGTLSLNKKGSNHATYFGSGFSHPVSTAAVYSGISQKISVTTGGAKNFSTTGLSITFPASGTKPGGDVWVTRTYQHPDELPDVLLPPKAIWIVNNYGTNATFASVTQMVFSGMSNLQSTGVASDIKLYKRASNEFGSTWGATLDLGDAKTGSGVSGTITFSTGLSVTSFSQFTISGSYTVLPLNILDFKATRIPNTINGIALNLAVDNNSIIDVKSIELECSYNGQLFESVHTFTLDDGIVKGTKKLYHFTDNIFTGKLYYRIKQINKNGEIFYSAVRIINANKKNILPAIFPNPVKKSTPIFCNIPEGWNGSTLIIYNSNGQVVAKSSLHLGQNKILPNLPAGNYTIKVLGNNTIFSSKLLIQ